jgi:CheY-like chemotaxis protein
MVNILIVDDNLTYIEGLRAVLQEQGHLVDYSLGVFDALERIKNTKYELIFVDMKMQDFTGGISERAGLNLVPLIRLKSPSSKIVMLTAGSKDTDAVETLEQGAVKYLRKGNFSIDYLLKLINQLLENQVDLEKDIRTKKFFNNKLANWVIDRVYGIFDEILAGLLITISIYMVGRISGLLSGSPLKWTTSENSLTYIIITVLVVFFVGFTYVLVRKRKKDK